MGRVTLAIDGDIATVLLSHPGKRNALTAAMWQSLTDTFAQLSAEPQLRCVIIRGDEGHFAGGADISEFPQQRENLASLRHYHEAVIAPALAAMSACPHPVVALIEGVCIGGGLEIAGRCDLRICGQSSRFGAPINRLGFPMAPDELAGLLALAGPAVTLEILLEGRILDAVEALAKGLVTRVVADADVADEAWATARRIAAAAPLAARINKQMVRRLMSGVPLTEAERAAAFAYADSADHREGVQAFIEGRAPRFTGH